jgi:hypothetical protein
LQRAGATLIAPAESAYGLGGFEGSENTDFGRGGFEGRLNTDFGRGGFEGSEKTDLSLFEGVLAAKDIAALAEMMTTARAKSAHIRRRFRLDFMRDSCILDVDGG